MFSFFRNSYRNKVVTIAICRNTKARRDASLDFQPGLIAPRLLVPVLKLVPNRYPELALFVRGFIARSCLGS